MQIKRNHIETGIFIAVYLFALYLWTLPFQDNQIPYGEFDAISHWEIADYIAQTDKTFNQLPCFLDFSYGDDNKFRPHTLWYPPPFHTAMAITSSFSGDRMVPIFLTNAIFATSILISLYFMIRKLYGFLPAILSSFILAFSMRDIFPYLWGQWPERFAYAFIPLILYCFYMYYTTYSKEGSKPVYLYLASLLLAINVLIHPLVFFHSIAGLSILFLFLFIKNRKMPFNIKHIGISLLIFLALFSIFPYQSGNVIVSFFQGGEDGKSASLSRLFHWGPNPDDFRGSVSADYFSFSKMHGLWTLPFLLIGLAILLIRRDNKDILMLAWLVSLYLILHSDLIGKATFLHRSLSGTAHIFVPITVIGALAIVSFVKLPQTYKSALKYGMAALLVGLALFYNLPAAYSTLNQAYDNPFIRLNPSQIEVSEWLLQNTNENQNVSIIGPPAEILQKVWWMASYSHRTSQFFEGFLKWKIYEENREEIVNYHLLNDYIVVDYSDIGLLQDKAIMEQWQLFEQDNLAKHKLLYNKGSIKVYKYEA